MGQKRNGKFNETNNLGDQIYVNGNALVQVRLLGFE
jgi:hypothetical protein